LYGTSLHLQHCTLHTLLLSSWFYYSSNILSVFKTVGWLRLESLMKCLLPWCVVHIQCGSAASLAHLPEIMKLCWVPFCLACGRGYVKRKGGRHSTLWISLSQVCNRLLTVPISLLGKNRNAWNMVLFNIYCIHITFGGKFKMKV